MSDVSEDIRRQAATLAMRRKDRTVKFTPEAPTRWHPEEVYDPESGAMFTPCGAWEFIARKLADENQSAQWVELENPPGKKAIVMIVPHGERDIYIKFQLGAGKLIGRSFHYSDPR